MVSVTEKPSSFMKTTALGQEADTADKEPAGARRLHLSGQLLPHVEHPLERREDRQSRYRVDGGLEEIEVRHDLAVGEQKARRQHDYPDGPGRNPGLPTDAERLRASAGVGHHVRADDR